MTSKGIVDVLINFSLMNGEIFLSIVFCEDLYLRVLINKKLVLNSDLIVTNHPTKQAEARFDDFFEELKLIKGACKIVLALRKDDLKCVHLSH